MDSNYITKKEAVESTGMSLGTINKLVSSNKVVTSKRGKLVTIDKHSLFALYPQKNVQNTNNSNKDVTKVVESLNSSFNIQLSNLTQQYTTTNQKLLDSRVKIISLEKDNEYLLKDKEYLIKENDIKEKENILIKSKNKKLLILNFITFITLLLFLLYFLASKIGLLN